MTYEESIRHLNDTFRHHLLDGWRESNTPEALMAWIRQASKKEPSGTITAIMKDNHICCDIETAGLRPF